MKTNRILPFLLLVSPFLFPPSALPQGSLTPPGAPAPTMKKLDEIEARTNLQATPAPAGVDTTNPGYHFIINQPGSYYLSANLGVTKTNGIQINSEGVILDLNGFQVSRAAGTGGNGIEIPVASHQAVVRNGSIKGFSSGINNIFSSDRAHGGAFLDLSVSGCTSNGIVAGVGAVLESCRVHDNTGSYGIYTDFGSLLSNCTAVLNTGSGIYAGGGSVLNNCTAVGNTDIGIGAGGQASLNNCTSQGNGGDGISAGLASTLTNCTALSNQGVNGIAAGEGSTLDHCTARQNNVEYGIFVGQGSTLTTCSANQNSSSAASSWGISAGANCIISKCTASGNLNGNGTAGASTGGGILAGNGASVQDCTAASNRGDGVQVSSNGRVVGNNCDTNGFNVMGAADGAGIHVTAGSGNCRIEGNNVTNNDRGVDISSAGNLIIKNSASGNATNYNFLANNVFGEIVNRTAPASGAVAGNNAPSSAATTDPWANISF